MASCWVLFSRITFPIVLQVLVWPEDARCKRDSTHEEKQHGERQAYASGALPAGLGQKLVQDCLLCPSTKSDVQTAIRLTPPAPDKPLA